MKRLFLLFLLCSCAQQDHRLNTASTKPEVCIAASPSIVSSEIAGKVVDRGYSLIEQSETRVYGEKRAEGMYAVMLSSNFNNHPVVRIKFNIIKTQKCARVIAEMAGISNPGSGYEKSNPVENHDINLQIQGWLEQTKASLEAHK